MSLRLTNTLNKKTEEFCSIIPNKVSIYCCGVTVYDLCHLGHARSYIVWDVLRRYLIWLGYEVKFVQNFTDIDDKIINKAKEQNLSMNEVSNRNIKEFHQDMDALGIMRADKMPRATNSLNKICLLIENLESKKAAYSIEGDVYFSVDKCCNYGKLSGRRIEDQQINADGRIGKGEEAKKKNDFDFALWKSAKEGEPSFPSPWGKGRPGWHIECSAMVLEEFGETIDIHLGGADLIFPHHENEIAQSEVATGKTLARYWLHNGMVNVEGQKMSKSLGNFTTIRSLLQQGLSAMSLRLFVLQAHYKKPIDFTKESLEAASNGWSNLNKALSIGINHKAILKWEEINFNKNPSEIQENYLPEDLKEIKNKFKYYMDDDLNTSGALSILFELSRPLKTIANKLDIEQIKSINKDESNYLYRRWILLIELSKALGLKPEFKNNESKLDRKTIQHFINKRKDAKNSKDYKEADKIREDLKKLGVEIIDKPNGITEWKEF